MCDIAKVLPIQSCIHLQKSVFTYAKHICFYVTNVYRLCAWSIQMKPHSLSQLHLISCPSNFVKGINNSVL